MLKLPSQSNVMAAVALCPELREEVEKGALAVDMSDVTQFSGAMAQLLISCARTADSSGKAFSVASMSDSLRQDFADLGLSEYVARWRGDVQNNSNS